MQLGLFSGIYIRNGRACKSSRLTLGEGPQVSGPIASVAPAAAPSPNWYVCSTRREQSSSSPSGTAVIFVTNSATSAQTLTPTPALAPVERLRLGTMTVGVSSSKPAFTPTRSTALRIPPALSTVTGRNSKLAPLLKVPIVLVPRVSARVEVKGLKGGCTYNVILETFCPNRVISRPTPSSSLMWIPLLMSISASTLRTKSTEKTTPMNKSSLADIPMGVSDE